VLFKLKTYQVFNAQFSAAIFNRYKIVVQPNRKKAPNEV